MPDSALDDFLKRFGAPDFSVESVKTQDAPKLQIGASGVESAGSLPLAIGHDGVGSSQKSPYQIGANGVSVNGENIPSKEGGSGLLSKAGGIATGVMDAAPEIMALASNAKGGQFDDSAEGGGVGKAGGAIMQGTAQGVKAGASIGNSIIPVVGGVVGGVIGGVAGGLTSTFAHSAAKNRYYDNRVKFNLKEDAIEKKDREQSYAMSEGIESLETLKNLKRKQLGLT